MGNPTDKSLRHSFIFGSVLLMLLALFTSRVLLSGGMIIFLLSTCFHQHLWQQFKDFISNRFLVGMSLLFVITLVYGIGSEDHDYWLRSLRIKLPLLLFPLAFAGKWQLTARQWWITGWFLVLLVTTGCGWSLWQYLSDMQAINQSYLRAKALPTPFENDHIRFSLMVCVAIMICVLLFMQGRQRILTAAIAIFLAVYLHILSARTGLLGLYIFTGIAIFYYLFTSKNKKLSITLLTIALVLPVLAYTIFPTFRNRIRYMKYDLQHIQASKYLPGSNDGSRLMSLKAGWEIMNSHPLGVGSGDVVNETRAWYAEHEPAMVETGLYPSSEWLMYGAVAGWPGFILFTISMLLPFFEKTRERMFWIALNAVMAFSFLFDIGLEVQFGVFIYVFVVLGSWKMLRR